MVHIKYIGKVISGKYKIYDKVGSGGMATVYLARDLKTNEIVAIKVLHSEYAENENFVKRFLKEAEIAIRMKHGNIARVRDFGKDGETYFIVMEFVQGKTLSQILEEKGSLPYEEVVRIASEVAKALSYARSKGLIAHRDIKPQNIMLTANGKVKVMDFGIAKLSGGEGLTAADSILGTPFYMSPEQAKGQKADIRSDLYALGITMYQMLTGKVPFDGETPWSVISMHLTKEVPPINLSDVPEKLKKVIFKLLEKDPKKRYQNPEELLKDLSEISAGKAIPQKEHKVEKGETVILKKEEVPQAKGAEKSGTVILSEGKASSGVAPSGVTGAAKENAKSDEPGETVVLGNGATASAAKRKAATPDVKASKLKDEKSIAKESAPEVPAEVKGGTQIIEGVGKTKKSALGKIPRVSLPEVSVQNLFRSKVVLGIIAALLVAIIGTIVFASAHRRNSVAIRGNGTSQTSQIGTNGGSNGTSGSATGGESAQSGSTNENTGSGIVVKKAMVISVNSTPQGAEIFINGRDTGLKTPNKVKETQKGTYEVTVKKAGYESATKTVNLKNGGTVSVNFELKALGGYLSIVSHPSGAEIFVDGRDKGVKTPNMIKGVPTGVHTITLKKVGYKSATVKVEVNTGKTASVDVSLQKATYVLKVNSTPQGAEIFINGKDSGFKTPHDFTLSFGQFTVELKKEGYETYAEQISLQGNKTISAVLKKIIPVKKFKNNQYAFYYPEGWTLEENPDEDTDIRIDSPGFKDGYVASVFIYHDDLKKEGIDEEEFLKYIKTQFLDNEKVLEEKSVEINGQNFYELVVSGKGEDEKGNPMDLKVALFFLKKGDIIYTLEFDATPEDFGKAWAGFSKILYSFTVP